MIISVLCAHCVLSECLVFVQCIFFLGQMDAVAEWHTEQRLKMNGTASESNERGEFSCQLFFSLTSLAVNESFACISYRKPCK